MALGGLSIAGGLHVTVTEFPHAQTMQSLTRNQSSYQVFSDKFVCIAQSSVRGSIAIHEIG